MLSILFFGISDIGYRKQISDIGCKGKKNLLNMQILH